jgi:hypothetical protein
MLRIVTIFENKRNSLLTNAYRSIRLSHMDTPQTFRPFTHEELLEQNRAAQELESLLLARLMRSWTKEAPLFTRVGEPK